MLKPHIISWDSRTTEEKYLESLFGSQQARKPHAYLVGPAGELIACPHSSHQTEILRNPVVLRYIPWADRANTALQAFYRSLPSKVEGYWKRVAITSPLDHEIIDAWYAAGGLRLARQSIDQEDPEIWELTGLNAKFAEEALTHWLEVEQPLLEVLRANVRLTVLPVAVRSNAHLEFPKRLEAYAV